MWVDLLNLKKTLQNLGSTSTAELESKPLPVLPLCGNDSDFIPGV